jgi:hypothetical protein
MLHKRAPYINRWVSSNKIQWKADSVEKRGASAPWLLDHENEISLLKRVSELEIRFQVPDVCSPLFINYTIYFINILYVCRLYSEPVVGLRKAMKLTLSSWKRKLNHVESAATLRGYEATLVAHGTVQADFREHFLSFCKTFFRIIWSIQFYSHTPKRISSLSLYTLHVSPPVWSTTSAAFSPTQLPVAKGCTVVPKSSRRQIWP